MTTAYHNLQQTEYKRYVYRAICSHFWKKNNPKYTMNANFGVSTENFKMKKNWQIVINK